MNKRFTFDEESGYVFDNETEVWLMTAGEVYEAVFHLITENRDEEKSVNLAEALLVAWNEKKAKS